MQLAFRRFSQLFKEKIGLNPSLISDQTWRKILYERMTMCGIEEVNEYYKHLVRSPLEFQEFIELITVSETWFFREKEALDFLNEYINKVLKKEKIYILSLPCSTGEEPYSIVMSLLDAGYSTNQINVDAIDISKKSLAKADLAVYNSHSFRGKDLGFRNRYFDRIGSDYELKPEVRHSVRFFYGNIFDSHLPIEMMKYDIIFCRNLLIYLSKSSRKKAIEMLVKLLKPDGVLVVSPVETSMMRGMGFSPISLKAGAYLKKEQINQSKLNNLFDKEEIKPCAEDTLIPTLQEARRLADEGRFKEAYEICKAQLGECKTNPEIYLLIGLIEHALGEIEKAEESFLRAVYLSPNCYEALVWLALLAEKQGNEAQAEVYRQRAKKVNKENEK